MANGILIVDDAAFMRMMIKDVLTKNGLEVIGEAENGAVAVEKFKELTPTLTIMDITMPEMDGLTALKHISAYHPELKVIMISARGTQSSVKEAILLGAKNFIVKPFNEELLMKLFAKL